MPASEHEQPDKKSGTLSAHDNISSCHFKLDLSSVSPEAKGHKH